MQWPCAFSAERGNGNLHSMACIIARMAATADRVRLMGTSAVQRIHFPVVRSVMTEWRALTPHFGTDWGDRRHFMIWLPAASKQTYEHAPWCPI